MGLGTGGAGAGMLGILEPPGAACTPPGPGIPPPGVISGPGTDFAAQGEAAHPPSTTASSASSNKAAVFDRVIILSFQEADNFPQERGRMLIKKTFQLKARFAHPTN